MIILVMPCTNKTLTTLLLWFSLLLCLTLSILLLCQYFSIVCPSSTTLDTFFHIFIFHGELVAQWQNQGYHDKEGYENFKELLEVPVADAQDLLVD